MSNKPNKEQIQGLIYEVKPYQDMDFHIFVMTDSRRETVDAYMDKSHEIVEEGGAETHYFVLSDAGHPDVSMTPYLRGGLNDFSKYLRENKIKMYSAIILPGGINGRIISVVANFFSRDSQIMQKYFTDRNAGEHWLQQQAAKIEQAGT